MFSNATLISLKQQVTQLEVKLSNAEKEKALAVEAARMEIRKEMQKDLTESDLKRVKAETMAECLKANTTTLDQVTKLIEKLMDNLPKINLVK